MMRNVHFSRQCVVVGLVVSKLGLVGARLLSCMGRTFQGWGSIPLKQMNIIVCVNT
jgi:hypothetical protein